MASTSATSSVFYERRVVGRVRRYKWPPLQLNFWFLTMLAASCTIIGIFSVFITIQEQLELPVPWYFPYYITVASLTVAFILSMVWMIAQSRLFPSVVFVGAFILLVLWAVGLIVVSIELWGPNSSVSGTCNIQVFSQDPRGSTLYTLAWLQQKSICQSWHAVFAFALVGALFLVWIMFMAYEVFDES